MDKMQTILVILILGIVLISVLFYRALPPGRRLVGFAMLYGTAVFGKFVLVPYVFQPLLYRGVAVIDRSNGYHIPEIHDAWGTIPEYNPPVASK
jgi:hypothetical protein